MSECVVEEGTIAARGRRLRRLRGMANIASEELAQKIDVSRQTLSAWENGNQKGLPAYGAEAVVKMLMELGIYCDFNWLWNGKGEEPYWLSEGIREPDATLDLAADAYCSEAHAEEIKIFKKNYPSTVIIQVKHSAMNPIFQKGDWIGGCWREISPRLLNQICIIEIASSLEVRLIKGRSLRGYHLSFMTYPAQTSEPFELVDQNPTRVAPIIRMWRS